MAFGTAPRYATLPDLRTYLSHDGAMGTVQDGLLTDCLLRAESQIDEYTRRIFAGTPGTVIHADPGLVVGRRLYLQRDCLALTSVLNGDGGPLPAGAYTLEPRISGPPYRIVSLAASYAWVLPTDGSIVLAGTWGYSFRPPHAIVQATVRLAAYLYRQKDVGVTDVAGMEEAGQTTFTSGMPRDVLWVLSPYRSRTGGVV